MVLEKMALSKGSKSQRTTEKVGKWGIKQGPQDRKGSMKIPMSHDFELKLNNFDDLIF